MNKHGDIAALLVLVFAVLYLIYLDWMRQGELDFLATEVLNLRKVVDGQTKPSTERKRSGATRAKPPVRDASTEGQ